MNFDRLTTVLTCTTVVALCASLFCFGVLWSFPPNVPAWCASTCVSALVAAACCIGEIVLRRKLAGTLLNSRSERLTLKN